MPRGKRLIHSSLQFLTRRTRPTCSTMAWRSHGDTNSQLVQNLFTNGLFKSPRVAEAMKRVDRIHYLPPSHQKCAYDDRPQPIGFGATISAPHMVGKSNFNKTTVASSSLQQLLLQSHIHSLHDLVSGTVDPSVLNKIYFNPLNAQHANALENLSTFLIPGARVLDVGSGSGYMVACFHQLIHGAATDSSSSTGFVLGIEHIPELAQQSVENLRKDGLSSKLKSEIKIVCEDGRNPDPKHGGSWDVIHVGAAAPTVPEALLKQLKAPGRMFIPVGEDQQAIYQIDKHADGSVTQAELYGVRYVPLTDQEAQLRSN